MSVLKYEGNAQIHTLIHTNRGINKQRELLSKNNKQRECGIGRRKELAYKRNGSWSQNHQ